MADPLGGLYTSGVYTPDSRALRPVSAFTSLKPAPSADLHSSVVAHVESGVDDIVWVSMEDDFGGKEVAVRALER